MLDTLHMQKSFGEFGKVLRNFAVQNAGGGASPSEVAASVRVRALLTAAFLNSHGTRLERDENTLAWKVTGNMSEGE